MFRKTRTQCNFKSHLTARRKKKRDVFSFVEGVAKIHSERPPVERQTMSQCMSKPARVTKTAGCCGIRRGRFLLGGVRHMISLCTVLLVFSCSNIRSSNLFFMQHELTRLLRLTKQGGARIMAFCGAGWWADPTLITSNCAATRPMAFCPFCHGIVIGFPDFP